MERSSKKWIRLNVDYADSKWLSELPGDVRRLWPDLLCYVKAFGVSGRIAVHTPARLASKLETTEAKARALIHAATAERDDGPAMTAVSGEWQIENWSKWQDPNGKNADRQRAFRERQRNKTVEGLTVINGDFGREESA